MLKEPNNKNVNVVTQERRKKNQRQEPNNVPTTPRWQSPNSTVYGCDFTW